MKTQQTSPETFIILLFPITFSYICTILGRGGGVLWHLLFSPMHQALIKRGRNVSTLDHKIPQCQFHTSWCLKCLHHGNHCTKGWLWSGMLPQIPPILQDWTATILLIKWGMLWCASFEFSYICLLLLCVCFHKTSSKKENTVGKEFWYGCNHIRIIVLQML